MISWAPGISLEKLEQLAIEAAYRFYAQNKTTTAQSLGISIRTLDTKLQKYEAEATEKKHKEAVAHVERMKELERHRHVGDQFRIQSSVSTYFRPSTPSFDLPVAVNNHLDPAPRKK